MAPQLRFTADIAPDALLPGDPVRALALAQDLLERPLMSNHSRGLWGYHGTGDDGRPLTIQSTGLGAPSALIVLEELAGAGVVHAVRVGTCAALDEGLAPGSLIVAAEALALDGASRALGAGERVPADAGLTSALGEALDGAGEGVVAGVDLLYDPAPQRRRASLGGLGASAADLPTAALFARARQLDLALACALVVTQAGEEELGEEEVAEALLVLGRGAARALAAQAAGPQLSSPSGTASGP